MCPHSHVEPKKLNSWKQGDRWLPGAGVGGGEMRELGPRAQTSSYKRGKSWEVMCRMGTTVEDPASVVYLTAAKGATLKSSHHTRTVPGGGRVNGPYCDNRFATDTYVYSSHHGVDLRLTRYISYISTELGGNVTFLFSKKWWWAELHQQETFPPVE